MASSGDLARAAATSTGLDVEVLRGYVKALRNDGLMSSAGRGPGAAPMELGDAAHFVIAILATGSATRAPAMVRHLSRFISDSSESSEAALRRFGIDRPVASFRDLVEAIIFTYATTLLVGAWGGPSMVDLSFQTPPERLTIVVRPPDVGQVTTEILFKNIRDRLFDADAVRAFGIGDTEAALVLRRSLSTRMLAAVAGVISDSQSVKKRAAPSRLRKPSFER